MEKRVLLRIKNLTSTNIQFRQLGGSQESFVLESTNPRDVFINPLRLERNFAFTLRRDGDDQAQLFAIRLHSADDDIDADIDTDTDDNAIRLLFPLEDNEGQISVYSLPPEDTDEQPLYYLTRFELIDESDLDPIKILVVIEHEA